MTGHENPPAFPSRKDEPMLGGGSYRNDHPGMTLRDYFAGQALAGLVATIPGPGCAEWAYYANGAYFIADAMLAARAALTAASPQP